ncbi:MAG TPA: hypothetical protein VFJ82_21430 [Longimicrobium sp.]|nr:hypothetical protein [Longimicrobium sp.]
MRIRAGSPAIREFVEQVHALVVYRREVMRTPVRTLAAEIGISKSAVDKFHKERAHPGKLWPKPRDWYMRTHAIKHDEYQTPPELMVASTLQMLSQVPKDRRATAIRATVEHLKVLHAGMPPLEWIEMLSEIADREESS